MKASSTTAKITPQGVFYLDGYLNETRQLPGAGVHDDPYAVLLLVEEGAKRALFVGLDICLASLSITRGMRAQLSQLLCVPDEFIVISTTHTHSCPNGMREESLIAHDTPGYADFVSGIVVQAASTLPERLSEVHAEMLSTHIRGWYSNRNSADKPFDDEAYLVRFVRTDGTVAGAMQNFNCHSTVVGAHNMLVTADLQGTVRAELAPWVGCTPYAFTGASGDLGNRQFGGHEALVIFDDVFIPNERVFMCKEYDFAGMMVERFAGYHRQSYGGCKVGVGDVLIGAAALAADFNGVPKASHIKDKLIEMMHLNETLYSCGIACSCEGKQMAAGNYQIDLLLANVCKQNVTRLPYEIARLAEDIAGGLMVTMPSQQDLRSPEIGKVVEKYFKGARNTSTENRLRILRLIENLTLGTAAVGYRTESMHGAGSPQAQRIMISRQGDLESKKNLARAIAKIDLSKDI